LALTASSCGITIDRIGTVLRWAAQRLDAALVCAHQRLESPPLRLILTDTHERLDIRIELVPTLLVREATDLLNPVTDKVLEPFPADDERQRFPEYRALQLGALCLAVTTAPVGAVRAEHVEPPDVMFALRLPRSRYPHARRQTSRTSSHSNPP